MKYQLFFCIIGYIYCTHASILEHAAMVQMTLAYINRQQGEGEALVQHGRPCQAVLAVPIGNLWFLTILHLVHQNIAMIHVIAVFLSGPKSCADNRLWNWLHLLIIKEQPIVMTLDQSYIVTCNKRTKPTACTPWGNVKILSMRRYCMNITFRCLASCNLCSPRYQLVSTRVHNT